MMKKRIVFLLVLLLLGFGACTKVEVADELHQKQLQEEIPAIVFMYQRIDSNGDMCKTIMVDNQGNCYATDNSYIGGMHYTEFFEEFTDSKLDDMLTLKTTCEMEELYENYQLVKRAAENNEYELVPDSEYYPTIETDSLYWYGFYYDEKEQLSIIELRSEVQYVTQRANDENANSACKWFDEVAGIER